MNHRNEASNNEDIRPGLTALVLAASRKGIEDPVASHAGKTHKCLVEVDGIAMIQRVIQVLIDSGLCRNILVSIESEDILRQVPRVAEWLDQGRVGIASSSSNLADSVLRLRERKESPVPLLITTADNALHTGALVTHFIDRSLAGDADISVGVTREATVREQFPDDPIGFFRFRDGGYSFCNLFMIRSVAALATAEVFRSGGQFRKRPWRILGAFGVINLVLYRLRLTTLEACLGRIGRNFGIKVAPVEIPWAYAPIDADNPTTLHFSERILRQRREQGDQN
ncbi:MAG: NTP transferase domain-containing protein [Wenzhouxiangellaceae bacterium]|nr:NTP transferase domain-containing protein [Wenzhouxiangellaceae bacterium]